MSFFAARKALAIVATFCFCGCATGPPAPPPSGASPSAQELLESSIQFHDPQGAWQHLPINLSLEESRPGGSSRTTTIRFDNGSGHFEISSERTGHRYVARLTGNEIEAVEVDGAPQTEISADLLDELGLDRERLLRQRNYYTYLYGLPMKLRDAGTLLGEAVHETEFDGRPALEVKVTYDPAVGSDTWYFYFDPQNHALIGYRFYHDENKGDGEYIHLKDLADLGSGVRLPRARTWYTHQGNELLGTDTVVSGEMVATP